MPGGSPQIRSRGAGRYSLGYAACDRQSLVKFRARRQERRSKSRDKNYPSNGVKIISRISIVPDRVSKNGVSFCTPTVP